MSKIAPASLALLALLFGCVNAQDRESITVSDGSPVPTALSARELAALKPLAWLEKADPVADARRAIAANNRTLLLAGSRGAAPPGIPPEQRALALRHCPARMLPGVTDTVVGPTHLRYLQKAHDYAQRYNRTMLAVCTDPSAAAPR